MKNDFELGMKVSLKGVDGVVVSSKLNDYEYLGLIRWDTPIENDIENWHGLFGTFIQLGGCILDANHTFQHIHEDGCLR
jgi:hypothetical protein